MTQPQDEAPSGQQRENEADGHRPIKPAPAQEAGTPETDSVTQTVFTDAGTINAVPADFARKLEKDRDRLRALLATAERDREEAQSALARSELALCYANDDRDQLRTDLARAKGERDDYKEMVQRIDAKRIAQEVELLAADKAHDETKASLTLVSTALATVEMLLREIWTPQNPVEKICKEWILGKITDALKGTNAVSLNEKNQNQP